MRRPKIRDVLHKAWRHTKRAVHKLHKFHKRHTVTNTILDGITSLRSNRESYDHHHLDKYKTFAKLAYDPIAQSEDINRQTDPLGYRLDPSLSTDETKVFVNPTSKHVVTSYRGTKPTRFKDLKSDVAIFRGNERTDPRFQQASDHFSKVSEKYGSSHSIDTTGHSLGGQLAKHVNDTHRGKVSKNVNFSRGSGLLEPFRKKQRNSIDVSNRNDLISLGARLQGGKQVIEEKDKSLLGSHDISALFA